MGLYVKQDQGKTELQQRLDAELRAKAAAKLKQEQSPEQSIDDAEYLKNTKKTTSLAWAWLLIFLATVGIFVWFVTAA